MKIKTHKFIRRTENLKKWMTLTNQVIMECVHVSMKNHKCLHKNFSKSNANTPDENETKYGNVFRDTT